MNTNDKFACDNMAWPAKVTEAATPSWHATQEAVSAYSLQGLDCSIGGAHQLPSLLKRTGGCVKEWAVCNQL
jgi:hypothetical protein